MRRKNKKRLHPKVFERQLKIANGIFESKVERKLKNSVKQKPKLDWIDDELKFIEIEEKLRRELKAP